MTVSAVPWAVLRAAGPAPLGEALRAGLRAGLADVEQLLVRAVAGMPAVLDPARPPFAVDGVRAHALLALLGARHGEAGTGRTAAAVIELTHLATRYHDGVRDLGPPGGQPADGAGRRRNAGAVLAGDLLFIRAVGLAAELPRAALRVWADTLGAVQEAKLAERPDAADEVLRRAAFALGASAAGRDGEPVEPAVAAVLAALDARLSSSAVPAAPAGP